MESPFGLAQVWIYGDWVIRSTALVLLAMSLATWCIIAIKALDQRTQRQQARRVEGFWHSADFSAGLERLGSAAGNPFHVLALQGLEAASHLQRTDAHASQQTFECQLHDNLDLSDWVERSLRKSVDDFLVRAQSGLPVLASVASTAPFVGLFGTVWGIYHALLGIGAAGQASIGQVAGPIGEALIMTALGLLVAIPAVLGYNTLVRGNKTIHHQLNRFAHDLHAYFVTGARVSAAGNGKVRLMKRG